MATIHRLHLAFSSPLSITIDGDLTHIFTFLPSDTLYSALYLMARNLDNQERLFPNDDPVFRLSSAFPGFKDLFFLPTPQLLPLGIEDSGKRERFVWISVEALYKRFQESGVEMKLRDGYCHTEAGWEPPVKVEKKPSASIDRMEQSTNLYERALLFYSEGAGLNLLVQCQEEILPILVECLSLLGERGVGGERSSGCGFFSVSNQGTFDWKMKGPYALLLSSFYPGADEISLLRHSYYALRIVRGYLSGPSTLRRPAFRVITVGSVLKGNHLKGKRLTLNIPGLDHPVYRFLYPFALPYPDVEVQNA